MKKIITMIVLATLFLFLGTACSSEKASVSEYETILAEDETVLAEDETILAEDETIAAEFETTVSGFVLTEGVPCNVDGWLVYEVISYDGEYVSLVDEAEKYVRNWWNDDTTFHKPTVVWVNFISGNIRGFQADGYLFLDPNTNDQNDLLATAIHEWLHDLVDQYTLIDESGFGRPVMEMVVEAITVDILGNVDAPTDNYLYFKNTPSLWSHKDELISAFRNQEDFSAYQRILGSDYMEILLKIEEDFS